MLPLIHAVAVAGTAAWFVAFLSLIHRLERDGRDTPAPRLDGPGRALVTSARAAFVVWLAVLLIVTLTQL